MSLRIPHFPLPPCDLVLLHSISRPLHITSKRRTPRPLRAWTRGLPFIFDMVRTRRAPPAPSLRHTTRQRASLAQMPSDSPSQAMDAPLIPPSKGATTSCPESSVRHPLAKRARTLGPGESSRASEPPTYSKVPSNMSPKTIIKRLMVTAPPIEGNIDYRARPFHSELYFDQEAIIDGRHGVLEARHIAEALQIPYEPEDPSAFRQWSPVSQRDMVRILSKGTSANSILLRKELPPGMLLVDVYMGFPTEPWLERRRLCRERFTLDKWNQLAGYSAPLGAPPMVALPVPPQPEHGELPAQTAPPIPTPEATSAAPPTTPTVPPVVPTTSEPTITILALEFRALANEPFKKKKKKKEQSVSLALKPEQGPRGIRRKSLKPGALSLDWLGVTDLNAHYKGE
uniref:Uncharacterized protein n=1 Tax=Vitis vinifera TaxID=29760 RepID=A5C6W3_VITVI|nr:hypothetical protein VITISV_005292 [Vitis vinifera]